MSHKRIKDIRLSRDLIAALAVFFGINAGIYAQTQHGTLESIPTKKPVKGLVQFTNLETKKDYNSLSNETSGSFIINLPDGVYHRKIFTPGHYYISDTVKVEGDSLQIHKWKWIAGTAYTKTYGKNQNFNFQAIEVLPVTSNDPNFHKSILEIYKRLTGTENLPLGTEFHTEHLNSLEVWMHRYNTQDPTSLPELFSKAQEEVYDSIKKSTKGIVTFTEVPKHTAKGTNWYSATYENMPQPGLDGYTKVFNTPEHGADSAACYISNQTEAIKFAFSRETLRAVGFTAGAITDPTFALRANSISGPSNDAPAPDEMSALMIHFTLKQGTYMPSHRDSVITNIPTYTGIQKEEIPKDFILAQNYPNPFNPVTTIKYALPNDGLVKLEIFNALGERVETIVDEIKVAGYHEVQWGARRVSSGVYFYRIHSGRYQSIKKMLLIK